MKTLLKDLLFVVTVACSWIALDSYAVQWYFITDNITKPMTKYAFCADVVCVKVWGCIAVIALFGFLVVRRYERLTA